jgi:allantoicase
MNPLHDFTDLPDLAVRSLGGSVMAASDEQFAERENLIVAAPPGHRPATFGHKGQVYDGWETRRRRTPGHDWAIVRLGLPGVVRGVVVDTAHFTGNYPPEVSVEGTSAEGWPAPDELAGAAWTPLVPRSPVAGDSANPFQVGAPERFTHVRLCIYPDGGVARLRVHGEPVPDPRLLPPSGLDLAALEHGGEVTGCSNRFYGSPRNLISPGLARVMGEGWETARRRDDANDWVEVRLAGAGVVRLAELDTSWFLGNAPGWASLRAADARAADPAGPAAWAGLLPRTRLLPDTRHRFPIQDPAEATHVRLDVFPDGGMARLRLWGDLAPAARAELGLRFWNLLPAGHARRLLTGAGLRDAEAGRLAGERPLDALAALPRPLAALLGGA